MGLFSFFGGKGKALGAAQAAEAPPDKDALEKELDDLGLDRSGVELEVEPHKGKVGIKGHPKDQETREKVILAVGNVAGVAEVEDEATGPKPRFHTVENGESLWKIAEAIVPYGACHLSRDLSCVAEARPLSFLGSDLARSDSTTLDP